ncbi:MAG: hypothetical protein IKN33_06250 [Selenomonadaceae bacterium]|nr:hypothetical protein [Selenomonadaceae bacterium]
MFPDILPLVNGPVFSLLTEPVTIRTADGEAVVAGLLGERLIGGHDFIENDAAAGQLSEWILEFRPGQVTVFPGDTVMARGMRFTVADAGQDACGNVRLVLRR